MALATPRARPGGNPDMDEATPKTCTRCLTPKARTDYYRRAKSPDGLQPCCKVCDSAQRKRYYQMNHEDQLAKGRARYAADPEKYKARAKAERQAQMLANPDRVRERERIKAARLRNRHPERYRETARRWRLADPDRTRELHRRYNQRNQPWLRAERKAYKRRWRAENREKAAAALRRHRALKKNALLSRFTPDQLAARLSMFPGCWICGGEWTEVDHVKPLAKGGAHCLANLRPICRSDNAIKSARWPWPTAQHVAARPPMP